MAAPVEMIAVLFTDLVASTELASRVGPERAEELRVEHFALLRKAIAGTNGTEVKNTGDGVMVVFPSAAAAVACAMAVQQHHEVRNRRAGEQLLVRVGISLGDAIRDEGDYFGPPVVEAARLCAKASPGQVLLTDLTRMMVGRRGDHSFCSVGELELKGLPKPVTACELAWEPLVAAMTPLPPRLRVLPETAYVGREDIRARLAEVRLKAEAGARQLVLIAGEPGIGKTRLASYVALEAHSEGAIVLYGHCDEELAASYQPWVQALQGLVEHCPIEVLEEHVVDHGGELRRLVPELARRISDVPGPQVSDPETERYLLFAAIVGLLQRAGAEQLVVLLDDLHWADKPSLQLLKHVISNMVDARLLVMCTYRDTDIGADHPLTSLLADLRREQGVEWVRLDGLVQDEVESLIAAAAGHDLDAAGLKLAEAVRRESDGNPFFVTEILRHLLESGAIAQGADGRYVVTTRIGELGIPRSVRDVIGQRIRRLGQDAVGALSAAAIIGREFDLELLSSVTDRGEDELLDSLEAAVAGSVLRESPQTPGRFIFTHALINHTLYEDLSRTRRARLHTRIAEAIEHTYGENSDERLGQLAYHWAAATQSVNPAKAISYARRAGERALAQLAPDEALRWFAQALDQLGTAAGASDADRCDLMILIGEAQRQAGESAYRETLLAAGEIAQQMGDRDRIARAALPNTRGWASWAAFDTERVEALQMAINALPAGSAYLPRLLAQLASEVCFDWDFATRVRPLIDEALELARRDADQHVLAHVLGLVSAALLVRPDMVAERMRLTAELLSLTDALGDPFRGCTGAALRCVAAIEIADIDEAHECAGRVRRLSEKTNQPWLKWIALFLATLEAQIPGKLKLTERLARDALAVGRDIGVLDVFLFYGAPMSYVRWEQGRLEEIIDGHLHAHEVMPGVSSIPAVAAFFLAELGRIEEANNRLDVVAQAGFESLNYDNFLLFALTNWGLTAVRVGNRQATATIYELLSPYHSHLINPIGMAFWSAHTILGHLAGALGRFDDADEHFSAASSVHERIGAPLFEARNLLYWAQMLLTRNTQDDAVRALDMLERASSTAQELGALAIVRDATQLITTAQAPA
ncbi:hypothetical protein A5760_21070 [Mycobacterium colombiense]|uniref:Guanylate cyclase domain-containing protein n=2 Tax=Mycobacterium colombiense TaxID=339268 RepID=A0A1A0V7M6_9MYCO|nr:hypothetical protein A5760_21070 [Mycobacterium colombiense]